MDRKAIIVLVASFSLLLLWPVFVNKIYPPKPAPIRTNVITQATNAVTPGAPGTNASLAATNPVVIPAAAEPQALVTTNAPEQVEIIENANARYTITSHGGGLKLFELKNYPEAISCKKGADPRTNRFASLNDGASVPALALLGGVQGDGVFQLTRTTNSVRAEKVLPNGLFLVNEFRPSSNYLVTAIARIENRGTQAIALPPYARAVGTATPIDPTDDGTHSGAIWSDGSKSSRVDPPWFANRFLGCFPGSPRTLYEAGQSNVAWAAVHNQFFALVVVARSNAALQVTVAPTNLPPLTAEEVKRYPKANKQPTGYQTALHYPGLVIPPGQAVEQQFAVYAGPKEFHTLARNGAALQNDLDVIMDYGGFWGFFSKILLLSMNGLHDLLRLPYGLVIILITVIIKSLFWPLTQASTRSMKRMQTLQPQMKALQEKYKEDPAKMNRKLMEFMKENKVSPMAGCLPMVIQLPVFIGFYKMIQTAIELRGAQFLWACDLTKPDTVFVIPGFGWNVNPMPLLMGVTMLWQARLTPPSPGMDPMQQKIMKYMPLMFLFILYNFSAGLTLYWTVQNLLTIAQMKLTRAKDPAPATPAAPARPAPSPPSRKKK
jgi:YidC/Oxa1 family membrane protein insertase